MNDSETGMGPAGMLPAVSFGAQLPTRLTTRNGCSLGIALFALKCRALPCLAA
jgi:hypothetical protein